jgi:hypothetical protein
LCALIYIKASVSGDESGYVTAYKSANPDFPQESTMDQLFTEEQFEVYRALGEHIGRRLVGGEDAPSVEPASTGWLRHQRIDPRNQFVFTCSTVRCRSVGPAR